jgi:hypothetical protein
MAEENMSKVADNVSAILLRFGFQTVSKEATANKVRLMGRVNPKRSEAWLMLIDYVEESKRGATWSFDVSKQYFKPEGPNQRVRYAWRVIFQGPELGTVLPPVLTDAPMVPVELPDGLEVPLHASPNRHAKVKPAR